MSGKGEMAAHGTDKNASKGGATSTANAAAAGPATNDAGDRPTNAATKPGDTTCKMHPDTTASASSGNGGLVEATTTSLMGDEDAPPPAPPPAPTSAPALTPAPAPGHASASPPAPAPAPAPVLGESFTADNGMFFFSFSFFFSILFLCFEFLDMFCDSNEGRYCTVLIRVLI